MGEWIALMVFAIILLGGGIGHYYNSKDQDDKNRKVDIAQIKTRESRIESIRKKYGRETAVFGWGDDIKLLMFFDKSKVFMVNGMIYEYSSIIDCKIETSYKAVTKQSETISTTKTSTGSMLGRAIVGTFLAGPIGAMAGAVTAKKKTMTTLPESVSTNEIEYFMLRIIMKDRVNTVFQFPAYSENMAQAALGKVQSIIASNRTYQVAESTNKSSDNSDIERKLSSLAKMKKKGLLTDEEFAAAKKKIIFQQ